MMPRQVVCIFNQNVPLVGRSEDSGERQVLQGRLSAGDSVPGGVELPALREAAALASSLLESQLQLRVHVCTMSYIATWKGAVQFLHRDIPVRQPDQMCPFCFGLPWGWDFLQLLVTFVHLFLMLGSLSETYSTVPLWEMGCLLPPGVAPTGAEAFSVFIPVNCDLPAEPCGTIVVNRSHRGTPKPWVPLRLPLGRGDMAVLSAFTVHGGGGLPPDVAPPRVIAFVGLSTKQKTPFVFTDPVRPPLWVHAADSIRRSMLPFRFLFCVCPVFSFFE